MDNRIILPPDLDPRMKDSFVSFHFQKNNTTITGEIDELIRAELDEGVPSWRFCPLAARLPLIRLYFHINLSPVVN